MFALDKHTSKITHASLTAENHGKDSHATLKGLSFRALEGGSVELVASLYFHPDEDEVGPLARLMKEDAELTLRPPTAQKAANDDAGEHDKAA
jgi:hypothetical protein